MRMRNIKIGFLGAGNMGEAILAGLIRKKIYLPQEIGITTAHTKRSRELQKKYNLRLFCSNRELAGTTPILILAVKPQQMSAVLKEIASTVKARSLIITVAAGLDIKFYRHSLGDKIRLIRAMPNTPAKLGAGITALYASGVSQRDRKTAYKIFSAVGKCLFISKEGQMDAVTALSGAGPAFVYLFLNALIEGGKKMGLPQETSKTLASQTLIGAGLLAEQGNRPLQTLITNVASKGGTTEAGLRILHRYHFQNIIEKTIEAATKRGRELREEFGELT